MLAGKFKCNRSIIVLPLVVLRLNANRSIIHICSGNSGVLEEGDHVARGKSGDGRKGFKYAGVVHGQTREVQRSILLEGNGHNGTTTGLEV